MGVPALFSNVVRRHPNVIKTLEGVTVCGKLKSNRMNHASSQMTSGYDNLYLDSNSIVYDCVHRANSFNVITDESIVDAVCKQIHMYINLVKPRDTVIIAFDGVAPVAKLENQRNRRYKSEFTTSLLKKAGIVKQSWDTTAITPGTAFMEKLDAGLTKYFGKASSSSASSSSTKSKQFGAKDVIISSSYEPGEGEHKIFDFIRKHPDKHISQRTVVYGLDADLIMLSINHLRYCPNLFLFRETPHFIRSLNRSLDPGQLYTLDIAELFVGVCDSIYGLKTMASLREQSNMPQPYDYVFMVSLLGNDYIPHNPAFNIRTGGLDILLETYRLFIANKPKHLRFSGCVLTDGNVIHWDEFREYMRMLGDMEHNLFMKEHTQRDALEKKPFVLRRNGTNPRINVVDSDGNGEDEDTVMQRLNAIPIYNREKEKYIEPNEPYWEERYYNALFGGERKEVERMVCSAYVEALEWTMRYYTSGCPDWRWFYPYAYAPLASDVASNMPKSGSLFSNEVGKNIHNKPVTPLTQLSYVLPLSAQHMLPKKLRMELQDKMEGKYGNNWEFEWTYCKYFWECHAKLPHIDISQLEKIVSSVMRSQRNNT